MKNAPNRILAVLLMIVAVSVGVAMGLFFEPDWGKIRQRVTKLLNEL